MKKLKNSSSAVKAFEKNNDTQKTLNFNNFFLNNNQINNFSTLKKTALVENNLVKVCKNSTLSKPIKVNDNCNNNNLKIFSEKNLFFDNFLVKENKNNCSTVKSQFLDSDFKEINDLLSIYNTKEKKNTNIQKAQQYSFDQQQNNCELQKNNFDKKNNCVLNTNSKSLNFDKELFNSNKLNFEKNLDLNFLQQELKTNFDYTLPEKIKFKKVFEPVDLLLEKPEKLNHISLNNLNITDMSKTTNNWKTSFETVRNRFGTNNNESVDNKMFLNMFSTNGSSKNTSNCLKIKNNLNNKEISDFEINKIDTKQNLLLKNTFEKKKSINDKKEKPVMKKQLGNFWLETINRSKSPSPYKSGLNLTATERLEQLHESVEINNLFENNNFSCSYRKPNVENLTVRRNNYLREMNRSQSPLASSSHLFQLNPFALSTRVLPLEHDSSNLQFDNNQNELKSNKPSLNFSSLNNAVAEFDNTLHSSNRNGCGRFPLIDFSKTINNEIFPKYNQFGSNNFNSSLTNLKSPQERSPSPDTLSDVSQNSLLLLPHPRPKHNLRKQLYNAGFSTSQGIHPTTSNSISNYRYSSPNFPSPTSNSVAMRVSVFENKTSNSNCLNSVGATNNLHWTYSNLSQNAPMSPKSTIFRTKPIIHVNTKISKNEKSERFLNTNKGNVSPKWRGDDINEASPLTTSTHATEPSSIINNGMSTRLQLKNSIAGKLANIKRFYYPTGIPVSLKENEAIKERVFQFFQTQPHCELDFQKFNELCKIINFPLYAKRAVYDACCQLNNLPIVVNLLDTNVVTSSVETKINFYHFCVYWNKMISKAHDEASRFIFTLAAARSSLDYLNFNNNVNSNGLKKEFKKLDLRDEFSYIKKKDFMSLMLDIIDSHPGLNFLKTSPQFHARYCEVVIVRIFWNVNRSWTGRITSEELRRSNFLETLRSLEEITDINKVTDYFSYEHFYVTYCKFWEIDTDHDMIISRENMREHCGGALTDRIIDRIFSGAVIRMSATERFYQTSDLVKQPIETINFEDFVAFLLAEEDKRHPTSIEYWFRCVDLDGDGVISLYEMEYFYSEIEQKLIARNMETLSLTDVICNLLDSVSPENPNFVTRRDLKRCGLAHRFFNTFVNYIKYLDQESSEGERASVKTTGDREMTDWETFCAFEYELLMVETDVGNVDGYVDDSIDVVLDEDEHEDMNSDDCEKNLFSVKR